MSLVLGATWPAMTPERVLRMTWNEISAALEYVYRYVEPGPASVSGRKYGTMSAYIVHGKDTFRDDISKLRRSVKR